MGTHISTNARPCASCGLRPRSCICDSRPPIPVIPGRPQDTYIFSGEIPPPTMWSMGEILHEDGTTQLIPQPVRWSVLESPRPVDTLSGGLSWTGVMDAIGKGPQSHGDVRTAGRRVPVWSVLCVFGGLVLIGFCLVMLSVVLPLMG